MPSVITGTGIAIPPNVVTNDDLARIMDTSDEWIRSRSGVVSRRFVDAGTGSSDLATIAGLEALASAGLQPSGIDALVTATMTPDLTNPGIAGLVQSKMGLDHIPVYDIRHQCSGFLYGLDLADALIRSDKADTVVVIGAEVHAGYQPWGDTWEIVLGRDDREPSPEEYARNTEHRAWSVLFGDGAGAVAIQRSEEVDTGFIASSLHTDGEQFELITVPGFGSLHRPFASEAQLVADLHLPRMDGAGLYRSAVRRMPESIRTALDSVGLEIADLDVIVAHQANERILAGVRKQLGVDSTVLPSNIDRWGNTTAATLPILFHELWTADAIAAASITCFTAFGAGAHWGAMIYRHPDQSKLHSVPS